MRIELHLLALLLWALPLCGGPSFEAASVKLSGSDGRMYSARGGPGTGDPGQITWTNFSMKELMVRAFGVKPHQVIGPSWITGVGYNIVAKVPRGTTQEDFALMLQDLLATRFHLQAHRETRDLPVFFLTVVKGGPKFQASPAMPPKNRQDEPSNLPVKHALTPEGYPDLAPPGGRLLSMATVVGGKSSGRFVRESMASLAEWLTYEAESPVVDKTGLAGLYDFSLRWVSTRLGQVPGMAPPEDAEPGPAIFVALQQQLGLKLEPGTSPIAVVVIDRADKSPVPG